MPLWHTAADGLLNTCELLFPIMNPIGCALLYPQMTTALTHRERRNLACRIAFNAALTLLVAIWCGTTVLSIFGINVSALRIAGGFVVAVQGWQLLTGPLSVVKTQTGQTVDTTAFVPLTIPFTTGPGTLSAAMTLGITHPWTSTELVSYFVGLSAAAIVLAACVAVFYSLADWMIALLGTSRAEAFARLSAFILLCVGVQILVQGLHEVWS